MAMGGRGNPAKIQSQLQFNRRSSMEQLRSDPNSALLDEIRKLRADIAQEMKDFKSEIRREIRTELKEINQTVERLTSEMTYASQRIDTLEQKSEKVELELHLLQTQKEKDLDDKAILEQKQRERCIKIRGLVEKKEENLMELLTPKFAKFLEKEEKIFELEIDRIFRLNSSIAKQKKLPRDVVVYFVRKHVRDQFLRLHNVTPFELDGKELQIFKDIPPRLLRRRKDYSFLTASLKDLKISYRWIFPEGLVFWYNKKRIVIKSIAEAEKFWEWMEKRKKAERNQRQDREKYLEKLRNPRRNDEDNQTEGNRKSQGEDEDEGSDLIPTEGIQQLRLDESLGALGSLEGKLKMMSEEDIDDDSEISLDPMLELEWDPEKIQDLIQPA